MPQIPKAKTPNRKNIRVPENLLNAPNEALVRAGQQMQDLGQYAASVFQRVQDTQDRASMLKFSNEVDKAISEASVGLQTITDTDGINPYSEETINAIRQRFETDYGDNGRRWKNQEPYLANKINEFQHTASMRGVQLAVDEEKAQLKERLEIYSFNAGHAETDEELEENKNEGLIAIELAFQGGSLRPAERTAAKDAFLESIDQAIISAAYANDDPAEMQAMIDRIDSGKEFKSLDTNFLNSQKTQLGRRIDSVNNSNKQAVIHARYNAATTALQKNINPDGTYQYEVIRDLLKSDPWLSKPEINLIDENGNRRNNEIDALRAAVNSWEQEYKNSQNKIRENNVVNIHELAGEGKISDGLNMLSNPLIDYGEKRIPLIGALNEIAKQIKDGINEIHAQTSYFAIKRMINQNINPSEIEDAIYLSPMEWPDKKSLLTYLGSELGDEIREGMKLGDKLLISQIAPGADKLEVAVSGGVPGQEDELTMARIARAGMAQKKLFTWFDDQSERVAAGKRDAITADEIYEYAQTLVPAYQISFEEFMEEKERGGFDYYQEPVQSDTSHPLWGMNPGVYKVDGRTVKWSGSVEIP